jgi:hypothetical protein
VWDGAGIEQIVRLPTSIAKNTPVNMGHRADSGRMGKAAKGFYSSAVAQMKPIALESRDGTTGSPCRLKATSCCPIPPPKSFTASKWRASSSLPEVQQDTRVQPDRCAQIHADWLAAMLRRSDDSIRPIGQAGGCTTRKRDSVNCLQQTPAGGRVITNRARGHPRKGMGPKYSSRWSRREKHRSA